jgi:formamidopyrimidine-DNA glycosylase
MPELPEVETTLRGVSPHLVGRTIREVIVRHKGLRWPVPDTIHELEGQRVLEGARRGKYLLFKTQPGTLMIHLGMSGALRVSDADTPWRKHDHVAIQLDSGKQLRFHDPRRFGCVLLIDDPATHPLLAELGPEPLSDDFDAAYLQRELKGKTANIKQAIMDSHLVVGVGNIYACEALFMAGISPKKPAGKVTLTALKKLVAAIKEVLAASIEMGGTTLRDFLRENGEPGYFKQTLRVYDREDEPCRVCSTPVKRIVQSNRSTFFCPKCQK